MHNLYLLGVHPVVNYWIDHGVGHGQPVETQIHVLYVTLVQYVGIEVYVNEISMIWQPTYAKYHDDENKHPHNLENYNSILILCVYNTVESVVNVCSVISLSVCAKHSQSYVNIICY